MSRSESRALGIHAQGVLIAWHPAPGSRGKTRGIRHTSPRVHGLPGWSRVGPEAEAGAGAGAGAVPREPEAGPTTAQPAALLSAVSSRSSSGIWVNLM